MGLYNQLSDGNPNGTSIGQGPADRTSVYNAIPVAQRSSPKQQANIPTALGQIITLSTTATPSPATVGANTTSECSIAMSTVTTLSLLTTDFIFSVNKNNGTFNSGLGIAGSRSAVQGYVHINFTNNTAATITPTAGDTYNVVALRGMNPLSVNLSPVSVAANTKVQQVFNLAPNTLATLGTPIVNGAGQITNIPVLTGGGPYQIPPTLVITSGTPGEGTLSGTFSGAGIDPAPLATAPGNSQLTATGKGGYGATGHAILTNGVVTSIQMDKGGSNYSSVYPPTATLLNGTYISFGQICQVNKAAQQAGLGITNVQVLADNQIGITYVNYTSAAITPTAPETYQVMALDPIGALSNKVEISIPVTSASATGQSAAITEYSIGANGVLASDMPGVPVKPTHTANLAPIMGRAVANGITLAIINPSGTTVTPAGPENYIVPLLRNQPVAPSAGYLQLLTPTSVAANTTAEQTFTVTGLIYTNSTPSTVEVRKPSVTTGIEIVGYRVTAANTLGITYQNTTAAAIVPPAEYYQILNWQDVSPAAGGWIADWSSFGILTGFESDNEQGQCLQAWGLVKGA